ncbi:fructosamine kinase family protein [Fulvitalea axinellae]
MSLIQKIARQVSGSDTDLISVKKISGGSINDAYKVRTTNGEIFLKTNRYELEPMFEKEVRGLSELRELGAMGVPPVLGIGTMEDLSFLALELWSSDEPASDFWENMGRGLAKIHRNSAPAFGMDFSNYIGELVQNNTWTEDGFEFFANRRLLPLAIKASDLGLMDRHEIKILESVCKALPNLLPKEKPAFLHGDLWEGNVVVAPGGQAGLIDPAVYFGFREAELAFTKLFQPFGSGFYESYQEEFPLVSGFEQRKDIYNLYPLLVHLILFGASYRSRILYVLNKFR